MAPAARGRCRVEAGPGPLRPATVSMWGGACGDPPQGSPRALEASVLTIAMGGGSLQTCKSQPPTPGSSTQILSHPPDPLRACRGGLRCPKGAGGPVLLQRLQGTVGIMITGPQNLLAMPRAPGSPHQGPQP